MIAAAALLALVATGVGSGAASAARAADGSTSAVAASPPTIAASPLALAGSTDPAPPAADELAAFRTARAATIASDTGWLTLVGLVWLPPGTSTFGRAKSNSLVLDYPAVPPRVGRFVRDANGVRFEADRRAGVRIAGRPITRARLISDRDADPTQLTIGTLTLFLIERAGHVGLRVRDSANPRRAAFAGLRWYPPTDAFAFDARFEPYLPAKRVKVMNVVGFEDEMLSPGALVFESGGREWRLDALLERADADELFVIFSDGTSGRETYGAGRYLYPALPRDGRVRLDFNRAYNPPCAFNDFATCPLPPAQNRIDLRIEAGELKYAGGH